MFRFLIKLFSIGLLMWLMTLTPARAAFCRQVEDRRICIINIERSANNYWQYQAAVSINGVKQPAASYDCRDRLITDPDGTMSSFRSRKDGNIVCSLYRRGR